MLAPVPKQTPPQLPCAFHLFSGPSARVDDLSAILRRAGWDVVDVDICNTRVGADQVPRDLMNDLTWQKLSAGGSIW